MGLGWGWDEVGTGTTLLNEGLVRALHWHNSSGWDLSQRADAHPSPGWKSSRSQAPPNLPKAAPACCGMSTNPGLGCGWPSEEPGIPPLSSQAVASSRWLLPLERLSGNGDIFPEIFTVRTTRESWKEGRRRGARDCSLKHSSVGFFSCFCLLQSPQQRAVTPSWERV